MTIPPDLKRLKNTFKTACLLHDIGHAPLSHSTEVVMPSVCELKIPLSSNQDRKATHEDYTVKAITDSSLVKSFARIEEAYGATRHRVADLIVGQTDDRAYFKIDGVDYFPLLHLLVSGELDCDRMDYLLRDSYFCGVSYGHYDLDWLIDNLEIVQEKDQALMGISERAVLTFNDFLLSRYHMFLMVYFHYKSVCLEQLLYKYFKTSPHEYAIPCDIEAYVEYDDYHLMKVITSSENRYARAIVKNKIPPKIYESFHSDQCSQLEKIRHFLEEEGIDYIKCSSRGKLSRYHDNHESSFSIKVVRTFFGGKKSYSDIGKVTRLFNQFREHYDVERIHCNIDELGTLQRKKLKTMINC